MFLLLVFFFFKQKTAYEMRISDWSSDVCSSDLTTADVAHHVTEIVFGGDDLDLHDRLEQDRAGLVEAFLEAHRAGDLERHFRRVDLMVRTVDQLHLDVYDRIAGKEAVRDRFLDALFDGRTVFLRHDAIGRESGVGRVIKDVKSSFVALS